AGDSLSLDRKPNKLVATSTVKGKAYVTTYTRNADADVDTIVNLDNKTSSFSWDKHRPKVVQTPDGLKTTLVYDDAVAWAGDDPKEVTMESTFDAKPVKKTTFIDHLTLTNGNRVVQYRDTFGRVIARIQQDSKGLDLVSTTSASGRAMTFNVDGNH